MLSGASNLNCQFYSEAFVTFTHLQESVIQREKDEIPFVSSVCPVHGV